MSDPQMSAERRAAILESLGRKEGDVMEDEQGEYVMVEGMECMTCDWRSSEIGATSRCPDHECNPRDSFEKLYLSDVELD